MSALGNQEEKSGDTSSVTTEDEEREFLLMPGVSVMSGFTDSRINRLCKMVLRLAFYFFIFQMLIVIVDFSILLSNGRGSAAAVGLVRVVGVAATLYLAYTGIKYKNQEWLCGMTFLHAYQIIMYLMLLFSFLEIIVVFILLAREKVFYIYQFFVSLCHVCFEVSSLYYIHAIFKYLPTLAAQPPSASDANAI